MLGCTNEYDVMIVALSLPDFSGIEVIRQIKKKYSDIVSILMISNNTIKDGLDTLNPEISEYLEKPVSRDAAENAIRSGIKKIKAKRKQMRKEFKKENGPLH